MSTVIPALNSIVVSKIWGEKLCESVTYKERLWYSSAVKLNIPGPRGKLAHCICSMEARNIDTKFWAT